MNETIQNYATLAGRTLLGLIFVVYGWSKIMAFDGTAQYMASQGLPMPEVLLVGTILVEFGGGLMIVVGWQARWAALAIALWLIPVTLVFHGYWAVEAARMEAERIQFFKNLSILGAMLLLFACGPGKLSLERK